MTEIDKMKELERSVFFDSPEELDKTCKRLGSFDKRSRALGLACGFRGLDQVKVLVKNGVVFKHEDMRQFPNQCYTNPQGRLYYDLYDDFMFSLADPKIRIRKMSYPETNGEKVMLSDSIVAFESVFEAVSEEERIKCVRYFMELDDSRVCDLQRLLYLAIINCDYKVTKLLKEKGVTISQSACEMLTGENENDYCFFWFLCHSIRYMTAEEFIWTVTEFSKELGEDRKINVTVWLTDSIRKLFYEPKVFECILDRFNQKKLNKKKTMQEIIMRESPELLAVCEKHGWLKMPRKRDEMIQFAADNDKTECTAWLLEFKNRTADLNAEQEKAEKKLMRELNADPDSVTELKKTWGFEKREDGGIVITRYKGNRTEVNVPEKIGSNAVKEIGERAFSPEALRLNSEQREFRKTITKITLPKTVEVIGDGAFYDCEKLFSVNIPDRVKRIGTNAFCGCQSLSEIDIPLSVKEIGLSAFLCCKSLVSAVLPLGMTEIGGGVFSGCEALQRVTIPPTVKKIGKWAFLRCFSLEEITIPEGVEEIGEKVFSDCLKLKSVTLPKSVKSIKNYKHKGRELETIFSGCEKLTVRVSAKSYAEKYCKRNNLPYIIKED